MTLSSEDAVDISFDNKSAVLFIYYVEDLGANMALILQLKQKKACMTQKL